MNLSSSPRCTSRGVRSPSISQRGQLTLNRSRHPSKVPDRLFPYAQRPNGESRGSARSDAKLHAQSRLREPPIGADAFGAAWMYSNSPCQCIRSSSHWSTAGCEIGVGSACAPPSRLDHGVKTMKIHNAVIVLLACCATALAQDPARMIAANRRPAVAESPRYGPIDSGRDHGSIPCAGR
jgi:hypothetical protein